MAKGKSKENVTAWVLRMAGGTFLLAVLFGIITQLLLQRVGSLLLSFIILIFVILLGVIFDTIGTAAAAAEVSPLNAKAACRAYGARKGVELVRNADKVANFCNDVVGDITGIISGAVATVLVINLLVNGDGGEFYLRIVLTAIVAALTVGGKAVGKKMALSKSTEIMLASGAFLSRMEGILTPGRWRLRKTKK